MTNNVLISNVTKLTPRERQVVSLASNGKSRKEIAYMLGISEETIKWLSDGIRVKLQTRNMTHSVAIAISMQVVDPPKGGV